MQAIAEWLVHFVEVFGYLGIFIMTFLESTMVPIPAELTLIPAGYLVHQGDMNAVGVMGLAVLGTICGALTDYFIAYHFGRRFLFTYGKYFFFTHDKMEKLDRFFASHGEISILTGRLVPGLRHFVSIPAGLAHMNVRKFIAYTAVGGGLWMGVLVLLGYIIGGNKLLVEHYTPYVTATVVSAVVIMILLYSFRHRKQKAEKPNGSV